jgi:hypothetical protein
MAVGMRINSLLPALFPALLLLAGCADEPVKKAETKKEPEAPAAPVSGNKAFFAMYTTARAWSLDAEPLKLVSIPLQEVPREPGKAGAWQATFVSNSLRKAKSYTYSVVEGAGNLHKGVFAGLDETWTGSRGPSKPFIVQELKVDSTSAYETAVKKGKSAAEFIKKNPDKNVLFVLEKTNRHPNLTWRVLWGDSVSTSAYSVFVDASTGEYLETMR